MFTQGAWPAPSETLISLTVSLSRCSGSGDCSLQQRTPGTMNVYMIQSSLLELTTFCRNAPALCQWLDLVYCYKAQAVLSMTQSARCSYYQLNSCSVIQVQMTANLLKSHSTGCMICISLKLRVLMQGLALHCVEFVVSLYHKRHFFVIRRMNATQGNIRIGFVSIL